MSLLSPRRAVLVFAALAFAYFLSTLVRAITATLAPTMVVEFGLGAADLGLLAGGYFLGFAFTQLPLGTWLDRFGSKRVEVAFLSVAVVGCLIFSMAQTFAGLMAGRVLCGVGVSACLMAPLTGYRRWYAPVHQMRANSWMLMVGALGMLASTLPVQWLLPAVGWRPIFMALAAGMVFAMVLIGWQLPEWQSSLPGEKSPLEQSKTDLPTAPGYAEVWRHPYFRKMAPLGFISYGGLVAIQTLWAGPWMVKVAGHTAAESAAGLFWINARMLAAYCVWGWVNPWLARRGYTADWLIGRGMPLSLLLLGGIALAGASVTTGSAVLWALSAYNLLIFAGVFSVQWGLGLGIDGLRSLGWSEVAAFQGAMGCYGLCSLWAYLQFLKAKKP